MPVVKSSSIGRSSSFVTFCFLFIYMCVYITYIIYIKSFCFPAMSTRSHFLSLYYLEMVDPTYQLQFIMELMTSQWGTSIFSQVDQKRTLVFKHCVTIKYLVFYYFLYIYEFFSFLFFKFSSQT